MEDQKPIRVGIWNCKTNGHLNELGKMVMEGASVICVQEIFGNFVEKGDLTKNGNDTKAYYTGTRKLDIKAEDWNVIFWSNNLTGNASMGVAIFYASNLKLNGKGVYTYNAAHGPQSVSRGMPWIKIDGVTIYSYHSTSAGDNLNHVKIVDDDLGNLAMQEKCAFFGDINITVDYYKKEKHSDYLVLEASPGPTRQSGKNIDYCLYSAKRRVEVSYYKLLTLGSSDHAPVLFDLYPYGKP